MYLCVVVSQTVSTRWPVLLCCSTQTCTATWVTEWSLQHTDKSNAGSDLHLSAVAHIQEVSQSWDLRHIFPVYYFIANDIVSITIWVKRFIKTIQNMNLNLQHRQQQETQITTDSHFMCLFSFLLVFFYISVYLYFLKVFQSF